jgi:hypothetical protein
MRKTNFLTTLANLNGIESNQNHNNDLIVESRFRMFPKEIQVVSYRTHFISLRDTCMSANTSIKIYPNAEHRTATVIRLLYFERYM